MSLAVSHVHRSESMINQVLPEDLSRLGGRLPRKGCAPGCCYCVFHSGSGAFTIERREVL